MKTTILRNLMVVGVTASLGAGYGDVPTDPVVPSPTVGAADPFLAPSSSPLTMVLYCTSGLCSAYVTGGSGTGYSFDWISAAEISDANGQSYARPNCYWYGQTVGVTVTASDSNGATVTEDYPVSCVEEP